MTDINPLGMDASGNPGSVVAGELIESNWGSAVADRVVKRYANKAAIDAVPSPPNGAFAFDQGTGITWIRRAGVWAPASTTRVGIVSLTTSGTGNITINFVPPFHSPPVVLATVNVYNLQVFAVAQPVQSAANVQVVRISDGSTVNNFAVSISYIAACPA